MCKLPDRVKSGKFGHQVNSGTHLQIVLIQMRWLLMGPSASSFFRSSTLFTVLFKENYNFPRLQRGSNIFRGGGGGSNFNPGRGGGQSIRIQMTCDFPGGGFGPPFPSGSSYEHSLFRCFAHGLKMCMSCALDIIVKLFSLSLFYELVIQLQVDICFLDTILMLPEFGPESGALATIGEFVLCVTVT